MRLSNARLVERFFSIVLLFQVVGFSYIIVRIMTSLEQVPRMLPREMTPSATRAVDIDYDTHPPALNISKVPWLSAPMMPRVMTRTQHDDAIALLRTFTAMLDKANITYIMCDGTLLGSYMSHDILPWDDDLDLMVRFDDLPKVKQIFKQEHIWKQFTITGYHDSGKEYDFYTLKNLPPDLEDPQYYNYVYSSGLGSNESASLYHKFKFFQNNGTKAGSQGWNWPFIDIKYYMENETHVWNLDTKRRIRYIERFNFYPLHLRPFGSLWLPAPRDTRIYLINKYGRFRCRSSIWNHQKEVRQHSKKVRCWRLSRYYPFVWRDKLEGGVLEVLKVDNKVIQYVGVPESFSILQRPFAL